MAVQLRESPLFTPGCGDLCEVRTVLGMGRMLTVVHDAFTHEAYGRLTVAGVPDLIVTTGPLTINLTKTTLTLHGKEIGLPRSQWSILEALAEASGRYVKTSALAAAILGFESDRASDWHTVRVTMARLRTSLGEYGQMIENSPTLGYRLLMVETFTPSQRGQWSALYPCCQICASTERLHEGGGLCSRCRRRQANNKRRQSHDD